MADGQSWRTLTGYPTIYRILNPMEMRMRIIFLANFGGSSILRKERKKACAQQPVFSQRPSAYIIRIKKKKKKGKLLHLQKRFFASPRQRALGLFFERLDYPKLFKKITESRL